MTSLETILSLALNARLKSQAAAIPADYVDALIDIIEAHVHCRIHHKRPKAGRKKKFANDKERWAHHNNERAKKKQK